MEPRKQAIIEALSNWIAQRPGLEFGNYGDVSAFRSEMRRITRAGNEAKTLLRAVAANDGIDADALIRAAGSAFSGRLTLRSPEWLTNVDSGKLPYVRIDYCTGQYWPTEYRAAVCAVLASALWAWTREHAMPAVEYRQHGSATDLPMSTEAVYGPLKMSAGDWLHAHFAREFGRGIASRWFS